MAAERDWQRKLQPDSEPPRTSQSETGLGGPQTGEVGDDAGNERVGRMAKPLNTLPAATYGLTVQLLRSRGAHKPLNCVTIALNRRELLSV